MERLQETTLRGCPAGEGHAWEEVGARLSAPALTAEPQTFCKIYRCRKCLEERQSEVVAGICSPPSRYEVVPA